MSEISSVNSSFYPGLVEGFAPKSMLPIAPLETEANNNSPQYSGGYSGSNNENVDLNNYYKEVEPVDILSKTGQNLVESAQVLDNTMVIALQNGYSVQDVCNIKLAEMAYKANAFMFKAASEISTFQLDV